MDAWSQLRSLTNARIALGRSGGSLPTRERLDFQLAHASARDAVLSPFDPAALAARLLPLSQPVLILHSAAPDRAEFLRRPDLDRRLAPESRAILSAHATAAEAPDLAIIVSDGLSAHAAVTQCELPPPSSPPPARASGWTLAPLMGPPPARVALQDEIGALLK